MQVLKILELIGKGSGDMKRWSNYVKKYPPLDFIDYNLRGAAQVVFMNNPISGICIIAGLFVAGWWTTVCGIIALVSSTTTAIIIGVDYNLIRDGLFGYSGILCGLAFGTFLRGYVAPAILSVLGGGFCAIFTVSIRNLHAPYKIPAFTLPFNFVTIFVLMGASQFSYLELDRRPPVIEYPIIGVAIFTGISQVYLAGNPITGGLFLLGTIICSPLAAFFMLLGSGIGMGTAFSLGVDQTEIEFGLWGYNSVLGTMAVGGICCALTYRSAVAAVLCGLTCTVLLGTMKGFFGVYGLPSLTFPFCFGTIFFMLLRGTLPGISLPSEKPEDSEGIELGRLEKNGLSRDEAPPKADQNGSGSLQTLLSQSNQESPKSPPKHVGFGDGPEG